MTLISKETLQADLHFLFDDYGNPVSDLARQVIDVVSGADEAYDVDKVIEQLQCDDCESCLLCNDCNANFYPTFMDKIGEIVRKGGVDG